MAVDGSGNLFVAEEYAGAITKILPNGVKETVAGDFNMPTGVAVDAAGNLFLVDTHNDAVKEILPNGKVFTLASGFGGPQALTVDPAGNVFVADTWHSQVVKLSPPTVQGTPSPVSGSADQSVVGQLTGLRRGTTYYYRVVMTGPGGTVTSTVESFRTA
jgi:DNA-binding beta-propeller fold protein YncE